MSVYSMRMTQGDSVGECAMCSRLCGNVYSKC